jgi:hypothetical protein
VNNSFWNVFKKAGNPSSSTVKRKHKSLSIEQKVDLLRKLDNGASVKRLCEEYSVGSSTKQDYFGNVFLGGHLQVVMRIRHLE